MITRSRHFDLGLDKTRMKDPSDGQRQHQTVDAILERLYSNDTANRKEVQILADEVGMGKTFVGLGVAYSVLAHMQECGTRGAPDLEHCYRKVLVITPQNSSLFAKWSRETAEFVRRTVLPEHREQASRWFAPDSVNRIDDLVASARRPGIGKSIVITNMGVFSGGKLRNYDLKRRFLLGNLFRHWTNRLDVEKRTRLLKGAPADWPNDPYALSDIERNELEQLPFTGEKALLREIRRLEKSEQGALLEKLLQTCREIAKPYRRGREDEFAKVDHLLNQVYRAIVERMLLSSFPLVVVDEAHNWKNGPTKDANGFKNFSRIIAPKTRRALLLTATPFQLQPKEILEILKVSDHIQPSPTLHESALRQVELARLREEVIRPVLDNSARASKHFSEAWSKLPPIASSDDVRAAWNAQELVDARQRLAEIAREEGVIDSAQLQGVAGPALTNADPMYRQLLREALYLYAYNMDLSQELGAFVIRHRRRTDHRLFRVGREYACEPAIAAARQDRNILHAAAGLDVRGEGELPHYLLMRCVSEMKGGKGRSSLGTALTGCYSTLLDSAEGQAIRRAFEGTTNGRAYFDLLLGMVTPEQDPTHPKIETVVSEVLRAWQHGEKSLVFCFRVNTARRLREIIDERIRHELDSRRETCLGGEKALRALRSRLTGRERDLVPLGMDRVFWSLVIAAKRGTPESLGISREDLVLREDELFELARLALRFGVDLAGERVDRVFLHRVTEHLVAKRLVEADRVPAGWKQVVREMAELEWVKFPYGIHDTTDEEGTGDDESSYDERGLHSIYDEEAEPSPDDVKTLGRSLVGRRSRQERQERLSILDVYADGPNLWLGTGARKADAPREGTVLDIHKHLWNLTSTGEGVGWVTRMLVLQSLRRALLRESVLLRLLPSESEREEAGWGDLLVQAFFAPLPHQAESMADRIAVYLEDLEAASGGVREPGTQRYALYESTRLRDQQFVALVEGKTKPEAKERVFMGFNTPLLPEVLICTSVGQEGIDLHRHCRHVVHYDLAWNPAVIEQRTGRTDRIGSKTFRERASATDGEKPALEIGVPFLAGTYDERMYEELRLRAQTFEVLTGGSLAGENAEGADENGKGGAEGESLATEYAALPGSMLEDLRVRLEVWSREE